MRSTPWISLCLWAALSGILAEPVTAQSRTTSAIRGSVMQNDTLPVQGAGVTVRHLGVGIVRTAVTDERGRYSITLLPPGGPYELTVSVLGFADRTLGNIRLQVGERQRIDVDVEPQALDVAGITVAVQGTAVFNPARVGPATILSELELEAVPILSRDLMDLAIISPFVTATEDGGFSILGQNDRYNAIMVDGVSNKDAFGLTASGVPGARSGARILPLDAIVQYEVLVAPFDVRLSGFTGGIMNAVTRTGTNEWRTRASVTLRNEALIGDLNLPTGPVAASGVDRSIYSFSVGGPIIRDKAHFYVTGEYERRSQPPDGFNLERDDPSLVRVSSASLLQLSDFFGDFGLDPGSAGPVPLDTELANIFGRVDWTFDGGTRLTVRNVFASADNDLSPNRDQFNPYGLSSNGALQSALNNTLSAQLFTNLGARGGNELTVTLQRTEDSSTPVVEWPQVGSEMISSIDGSAFRREVRTGSQFFAQDFDLNQTRLEITNSTTLVNESSTWALGATLGYQDVGHRFLPGSRGDYFFASIEDLQNNAPQRYQRNLLLEGQDPTVNFSVLQWGVFFQNQIEAEEGVTLHFGARLDAPYVLGSPAENPQVLEAFDRSTANLPSGQLLFSPRFGFNVQTGGRLRTQVRAGIGMFAGQMPLVWLSNAFNNNGLRSVLQLCEGRVTDDPPTGNTAPPFDPGSPPTGCALGPPTELRTVVMFADDFKYPQELRILAAADQELSESLTASFGLLYTQATKQVALRDLNIGRPGGDPGSLEGYGGFDRRIFGTQAPRGYRQNPVDPAFDHVLLVENENRNWAIVLTAELQGRLFDRVQFRTGYTYGRSFDTMSLTYNDMLSNFGFNPTHQDPNRPTLDRSNFDRPHKVVASLSGALIPSLPDTKISLLFTGQSGVPFSYVYRGDLNGDGYPGLGGALDRNNDLIYVPKVATELPSGIATISLLDSALESDSCLNANLGELLDRNACSAPFQSRLDLRIAHTIRRGGTEIRLEGDVINLLNLMNSGWGNIRTVSPTVAILKPTGRSGGGFAGNEGALFSTWSGAILPQRDEQGNLRAADPWTIRSPDSQWQAQFGVRVTFDGGR